MLYRRLAMEAAGRLTEDLAGLSVDDAVERSKGLEHDAVWYGSTGGIRVQDTHIQQIQEAVRHCAESLGYPKRRGTKDRLAFDAACSALLHQQLELSPSEASRMGVWTYLTCIALPDIVVWRFGTSKKRAARERFIGSSHGQRRNTIGRMWWRAHLLRDPNGDGEQAYSLLSLLGEDELVAITERPSLAGNPKLARQIGLSFLEAVGNNKGVNRRDLIRDAVKRIRRRWTFIAYTAFNDGQLKLVVDAVLSQSAQALLGQDIDNAEPDVTQLADSRIENKAPIHTNVSPPADLTPDPPADVDESQRPITITEDLKLDSILNLGPGKRVIIKNKRAKKAMNSLLANSGFSGEYVEDEGVTYWRRGSQNYCVEHKPSPGSGGKSTIQRIK